MADAINRAIEFIEKTKRLGDQLKRASEQQKIYLSALRDMYNAGNEDSEEYRTLARYSEELQSMLDKWTPIYKDRLKRLDEVKALKRKE